MRWSICLPSGPRWWWSPRCWHARWAMTRRAARTTDADLQHPCPGLDRLCGLPVRRRLRRREARRARWRGLAALAHRVHAVAVDLLHRLDVLRRRRLCGAVGAGISDDLSRPLAGDDRLVVGGTKAGADRQGAPHHLGRRSGVVALWQIHADRRHRHGDGGGGGDALHRAAVAVDHPVVQHLRPGGRRLAGCRSGLGRVLVGLRAGAVHHPVRHPQP